MHMYAVIRVLFLWDSPRKDDYLTHFHPAQMLTSDSTSEHRQSCLMNICYCWWCSLELVCGTHTRPWATLTCKHSEMWSVFLLAPSPLCVGGKKVLSRFLWLTYKHWRFWKLGTVWTLHVWFHDWSRDVFNINNRVNATCFPDQKNNVAEMTNIWLHPFQTWIVLLCSALI